jgi:hypothetical protein
VGYVLIPVKYLQNPWNANFIEALEGDSVNEMAEGNTESDIEGNNIGVSE